LEVFLANCELSVRGVIQVRLTPEAIVPELERQSLIPSFQPKDLVFNWAEIQQNCKVGVFLAREDSQLSIKEDWMVVPEIIKYPAG